MPLPATIEIPAGQTDPAAFDIKLRVTNPTDRGVAVLNPDMGVPSPAMKWPFSNEVYQSSMLMSFGYLSMSLTDETGKEIPQQPIQAWATPVLQPPLELGPGDALELVIPLGNFYRLERGKTYKVAISYGDQKLKSSATDTITVP